MTARFQHISDLSALCRRLGVEHIVISPGSRNAPLTTAFFSEFGNKCHSIVDERSAAYVALGMARNLQKPAVMISTSGTAVLNYAPAIAEAYYQRIPLVVITADRPEKWIDQQDNQTIRQKDIYRNYIVNSISLPESIDTAEMLKNTQRRIVETIRTSISKKGPVHINVPLDEPLYVELPAPSSEIETENKEPEIKEVPADLIKNWKEAKSILIIHGQDLPDAELQKNIGPLLSDPRVVMVAENLSNLTSNEILDQPELMLFRKHADELPQPDLLLYAGGQVVSKRIKTILRTWEIANTWRIGSDLFEMDTFSQKNNYAKLQATEVYKKLGETAAAGDATLFKSSWQKMHAGAKEEAFDELKNLTFSDAASIKSVFDELPENTVIEIGNSSAVRLSQLLPHHGKHIFYSNRGVSGIDGCLSAAVGTALTTKKTVVVILGDLSFMYDSNALWNRELPSNLKIVVLNNRGGGLFGLIKGPSKQEAFEDFFLAHHPVNIQKVADAFDLNYFYSASEKDLAEQLPVFLKNQERPALLEISTEHENNKTEFYRLINRL